MTEPHRSLFPLNFIQEVKHRLARTFKMLPWEFEISGDPSVSAFLGMSAWGYPKWKNHAIFVQAIDVLLTYLGHKLVEQMKHRLLSVEWMICLPSIGKGFSDGKHSQASQAVSDREFIALTIASSRVRRGPRTSLDWYTKRTFHNFQIKAPATSLGSLRPRQFFVSTIYCLPCAIPNTWLAQNMWAWEDVHLPGNRSAIQSFSVGDIDSMVAFAHGSETSENPQSVRGPAFISVDNSATSLCNALNEAMRE